MLGGYLFDQQTANVDDWQRALHHKRIVLDLSHSVSNLYESYHQHLNV
jgi:hypothetical protein